MEKTKTIDNNKAIMQATQYDTDDLIKTLKFVQRYGDKIDSIEYNAWDLTVSTSSSHIELHPSYWLTYLNDDSGIGVYSPESFEETFSEEEIKIVYV